MPTALFDTQHTIGIREDLTDIITNVSPTETPFFSSIGRTSARNTLHEWQTVSLTTAATAGGNAAAEGASAAPASGQVTTRLGNYTQIFTKQLRVTNTVLNINEAGRANEWAFQMELKSKEIARDIESQLIKSSAQTAGDVSAETGRQLEGLGLGIANASMICALQGGYLSANVVFSSGGDGTGSSASYVNLSETKFNNCLEDIWTDGGNPDMVLCNGYQKRVISSFSANSTRYSTVDFGDKSLNASVDVYMSDFGQVKIVLDRYVDSHVLGIVETQFFAIAELRPLTFTRLAKDGDRELGQFVTELTLAAYAPTVGGKIIQLPSASGATTA
jgi:hypothetical protein